MNPVATFFLWVSASFTMDAYMISTKVQGITWSVADITLVFFLLKIADLVRQRTNRGKIRVRYLWLFLSAFLTPFLVLVRTPKQFLILESVVCGIQFSVLVHTVISERRGLLNFFRGWINGRGSAIDP